MYWINKCLLYVNHPVIWISHTSWYTWNSVLGYQCINNHMQNMWHVQSINFSFFFYSASSLLLTLQTVRLTQTRTPVKVTRHKGSIASIFIDDSVIVGFFFTVGCNVWYQYFTFRNSILLIPLLSIILQTRQEAIS